MTNTGAWRGELRWGVKDSFLAYVRSSGGEIRVGAPCRLDGDEFVFLRALDGVQIDGLTPRGVARFEGSVRFIAHGGMLDVTLADPSLDFGAPRLMLNVADEDGDRIDLAQLGPAGALDRDGVLEWIGVPAMLTGDGSDTFNGVYPSYTEFAPLSLTLAVG